MNRRTVLVTGASSGIGRAISMKFASEGWNVVCHYCSSTKKAEEIYNEIRKCDVDVKLIKADFSSPKQLKGFVDKAAKMEIDCIINNAGTYIEKKDFVSLDIEILINVFTVNTFSAILLAGGIFNQMKEKGFGRIVNISSIAAKYGGSDNSMHYSCSKLALEGLAKTLSKSGAAYNVFINTIRPGVIDTDFHRKFPKDMDRRVGMIPMKKMGKPEDVAIIAYYLGSDMNNFMTGETVTVSGGE